MEYLNYVQNTSYGSKKAATTTMDGSAGVVIAQDPQKARVEVL